MISIFYTTLKSIVGTLFIVEKNNSIDSILFEKDKEVCNISQYSLKETDLLKECKTQLDSYFKRKLKVFSFTFNISGTEFQKSVYQKLLEIPYGELVTYKDIAVKIGSPNSCRAVGMANHINKVPIVIPCHRVIASSGDLCGYASGVNIKKILIDLEKNNLYN